VLTHNLTLLRKWAELKPDLIGMGDDLGTQTALMVSPRVWRTYLLPAYREQFKIMRESGAQCYFHSDGCILEVIDDLIQAGVSIINPQIGANGLDNLVTACKGRVCVMLDLDRQNILPFGSPQEVMDHVRETVEKLGSPSGGLMLLGECQPNVPLANIEALCQAMEQFRIV
jgi:uroporphyrinogen-III decarboxylase